MRQRPAAASPRAVEELGDDGIDLAVDFFDAGYRGIDQFERAHLALRNEIGLRQRIEPGEIGRGERRAEARAIGPATAAVATVDFRKCRRESCLPMPKSSRALCSLPPVAA